MIRRAAVMLAFAPTLAMADAPERAVAPAPKPAAAAADPTPAAAAKPAPAAAAKPAPSAPVAEKASNAPGTPTEVAACHAALDTYGTAYEVIDDVRDADPGCGFSGAVKVSRILPDIALTPPARIRCETARAMAEWVRDFVLPAANYVEERGALNGIRQGAGFVCRRRNNQPDGKLSEHSFGTAIDVMAFEFADGAPIAIEPRERDGTMAESFQDAVRATACLTFTTVLGPGSDDYHDDHLHLDIKERNGGFRLCQ